MPSRKETEVTEVLERQIQGTIRGHELIVDALKTPGLAEMLNELRNPELRKRVMPDPLAEARKRGVRLPAEGVRISVRENLRGWEIEVQVIEDTSLYTFGFSSMHGFYSR